MASIKLQDLHKKYGDVHAVRGISFEVKDHEFVALLGPSGCGKSSTMRMIAGLESVTGGAIFFDDVPVNKVRPRNRNVAMAFETYALYPTLSVYENLAFPLRSAGWTQDKVDEKVKEYARLMELSRLLDRTPGELSGGQAQRVGLARALVREPAVFLLDEPISHLDTRQRFRMRQLIKRLHLELKFTMILVTHDQEEAMAMADRIVIMREGEILQIGTPDQVYQFPDDEFVAGFVGEPPMNFLDGQIRQEDGHLAFSFGPHRIPLPGAYRSNLDRMPPQVKLGIRPFYVSLSLNPNAPHDADGEVFVSENLCDWTVVSIDSGGTRLQVTAPPTFNPARHERIYMKFNPEFVRLFDTQTGKAFNPRAAG
ncbi:MAG: ABC transporter ATP-binding protein [Chloroflexi bacterium]|nr:ABC transporter ATP-binding protein [Chloroflexota bacterium]